MMEKALTLAKEGFNCGEVPVGAVIVNWQTKEIIAASHNRVEERQSPLAHAEICVIEEALAATNQKYLSDYDIYVTLEPCPLCAGALSATRIRRVYFGAYDAKSGGVVHGPRVFESKSCHSKPEVYGGIMEEACMALLQEFFQQKREV